MIINACKDPDSGSAVYVLICTSPVALQNKRTIIELWSNKGFELESLFSRGTKYAILDNACVFGFFACFPTGSLNVLVTRQSTVNTNI